MIAAAAMLPWATAAQAQHVHKLERVEVTGSNIKRVDAEGPLPLLVISREDLDRSAGQNLQEVLNALPYSNLGSFAESLNAGNNSANSTAAVSLRGLGVAATLVLLNGRRLAQYSFAQNLSTAFVDLNAIPVSAIERIEILKDGASAIYGSDAIAGVVNVILRSDFRGVEFGASHGQSSRGDSDESRAWASAGVGDLQADRYNAMVALDYYHRDPLWGSDRERTRTADQRGNGGIDVRPAQGSPGTWQTAGRGGFTTNTVFPDCPAESRNQGVDPFGVCAFDQNLYVTTVLRTQRKGVFGRAVGALSSGVAAFVEGAASDNQTTIVLAPTPDGLTLPVGHNSNPFPFPVPILYRYLDVGPRIGEVLARTRRLVAGLRGAIGGFDWEAAYTRATSRTYADTRNFVTVPARNAILAAGRYNFVHPELNDPADVDFLRAADIWRRGESGFDSFDARATGALWELPSGPLALALGFEHRRQDLSEIRDPMTSQGLVIALGRGSVAGERTMSAAFAELQVPVPANVEAQLAVRHERYSDYGDSTVPKLAMSWRPAAGLLVRAGYTEGFRAPSLVQLYLAQSLSAPRVADTNRCNGYRAAFGSTDTRTQGACASLQIWTATGGNPELTAEASKGESLGIVLEPWRGLSIALDGYWIRYQQRIVTPTLAFLVANEELFPGAVVRDPPGPDDMVAGTRGPIVGSPSDALRRTGINQFFFNAASQSTRGIDLEIRWRGDIGALGTLRVESLNTYIDYLRSIAAPGLPPTELTGLERAPRYRGTHSAIWSRGPWGASLMANVVGSSSQPNEVNGVRGSVASWTTVDLQSTYSGFRNLLLTVGVRNLLDRDPPFYNGDAWGYDTATHSVVGRLYYARVLWRFR